MMEFGFYLARHQNTGALTVFEVYGEDRPNEHWSNVYSIGNDAPLTSRELKQYDLIKRLDLEALARGGDE